MIPNGLANHPHPALAWFDPTLLGWLLIWPSLLPTLYQTGFPSDHHTKSPSQTIWLNTILAFESMHASLSLPYGGGRQSQYHTHRNSSHYPLSIVELLLREDVFQALVISVETDEYFILVVAPNPKSKDHCCQLQIVWWIVPLVDFQLLGCLCYHSIPLHHYTAKSNTWHIIVYHEVVMAIWKT